MLVLTTPLLRLGAAAQMNGVRVSPVATIMTINNALKYEYSIVWPDYLVDQTRILVEFRQHDVKKLIFFSKMLGCMLKFKWVVSI